MAGFTHRLTNTFGAGSTLIGDPVNVTGDTEENVSVVIPNNTADYALNKEWPAAKLVSVFITVDKDCTLEVNSSSAPDQTIALKAGHPFSWEKDSGMPYPFVDGDGAPVDVTNLYVTVPTTDPVADCEFELRALVDL